jgi:hypothetical protein
MAPATLSYAQSLRVIGQALDALRINAFKLEKRGEKYIVRNWEPSFLRGIAEKVWGRHDSNQMHMVAGERSAVLIYTNSDTNRLEAQGLSRRGSDDRLDPHNISLALRALGDYLDKKRAVGFDISWSVASVTVKYETSVHDHKEEVFTVQNLHDLGVGMYLRRSSRRLAK